MERNKLNDLLFHLSLISSFFSSSSSLSSSSDKQNASSILHLFRENKKKFGLINKVARSGRVPLKDTLRRRISTTVAPRTDFPRTSSTSLRFSTVPKTRQKTTKTFMTTTTTTTTTTTNKRKEGTTRSSTIRPRRPQIIDYDYYEDEDTPIIEKTMYNGKLFLTNSGTIRCLDQGNFPHPISCKKFITCAKMVNGLIIGAEYTCPHKLSFDPVGGICNWSAGLGCKE